MAQRPGLVRDGARRHVPLGLAGFRVRAQTPGASQQEGVQPPGGAGTRPGDPLSTGGGSGSRGTLPASQEPRVPSYGTCVRRGPGPSLRRKLLLHAQPLRPLGPGAPGRVLSRSPDPGRRARRTCAGPGRPQHRAAPRPGTATLGVANRSAEAGAELSLVAPSSSGPPVPRPPESQRGLWADVTHTALRHVDGWDGLRRPCSFHHQQARQRGARCPRTVQPGVERRRQRSRRRHASGEQRALHCRSSQAPAFRPKFKFKSASFHLWKRVVSGAVGTPRLWQVRAGQRRADGTGTGPVNAP